MIVLVLLQPGRVPMASARDDLANSVAGVIATLAAGIRG